MADLPPTLVAQLAAELCATRLDIAHDSAPAETPCSYCLEDIHTVLNGLLDACEVRESWAIRWVNGWDWWDYESEADARGDVVKTGLPASALSAYCRRWVITTPAEVVSPGEDQPDG